MIHPIAGGGLLGERPAVPGGRERTKREEQLQPQIEGDTAQGPVVKAKKAPSAPSLDEVDMVIWQPDMPSINICPFSVAGKGKSESYRRMGASRDHGHPELHLVYADLGGGQSVTSLGGRFSKDRWLITHLVPCKGTQLRWIVGKLVHDVIMSGVQTLVVKSDQEASIVDVKNALMREMRVLKG